MNVQDLREKTIPELTVMVDERRSKLRDLRFEIANRQLRNHRQYRLLKREVASLMTVLHEKS